jgi:predicted RNase H-like nuclease (RuvC/YqgF family)
MTRRNLSDILRQEVQKEAPADAGKEPKPAVAPEAGKATAARTTRKADGDDAPAKEKEAANGQLTAQIAELKAALAQGAEHEKDLQGQIKSLQAEVKRQQKEVESLEAQVAQVSTLKKELTEAKEVILQLSEANTEMSKTLDTLKTPKAEPQRKAPLSLRPLPPHSVQHSKAPSSNASQSKSVDVGWMD